MESVIVTDKLTKRYGHFVAASELTFEVQKGEIFGFLGANGAGKTTAMRMLCGLLVPSSGKASVAGYDVYRYRDRIKQNIGYMSQKFSLYEKLTVSENIRFYAGIYGLSDAEIRTKTGELLERLGLQNEARTYVSDLPLGWKQKLAFSVAIAHDPKIVFLDEPTGGVDPVSRRQFWDLIGTLADSGVTVLVTTHYLDEAEHCHRLAIIHRGQMVALGSAHELKSVFASRPIVELHTPQPVQAMSALESMPEVEKTSIFGTAVHAVLRSVDVQPTRLQAALESQGIAVSGLGPVTPSLEDVFLDVVERTEQAAQGGQAA